MNYVTTREIFFDLTPKHAIMRCVLYLPVADVVVSMVCVSTSTFYVAHLVTQEFVVSLYRGITHRFLLQYTTDPRNMNVRTDRGRWWLMEGEKIAFFIAMKMFFGMLL